MKIQTNISQGEGNFTELAQKVREYGFRQPAIICDKRLIDSSVYVSKVVLEMSEAGTHVVYYDCPFEPSYQYLDQLMEQLRHTGMSNRIDSWIGIGGGSVLDVAKGLAILSKNDGPALNFRGFPRDLVRPLPVIAVPSTTGTGSEVVYNASFIDEISKIKMGINCEYNYPVLAILDPKVVATAPKQVLVSSGCDALVHSLESFVSPKSTPETRVFSVHAFRLIMENMPTLIIGEGSLDNWTNMQWAATFAMLGLSNTTSGPTGALSYYLGTHFRVPHGIAGAVFIAKVSRHNHDHGYWDYAELYPLERGVDDKTMEQKSEFVIRSIENLIQTTDINQSLTDHGVTPKDHPGFLEFAEQVNSAFLCNPVSFSKSELATLIQ